MDDLSDKVKDMDEFSIDIARDCLHSGQSKEIVAAILASHASMMNYIAFSVMSAGMDEKETVDLMKTFKYAIVRTFEEAVSSLIET